MTTCVHTIPKRLPSSNQAIADKNHTIPNSELLLDCDLESNNKGRSSFIFCASQDVVEFLHLIINFVKMA